MKAETQKSRFCLGFLDLKLKKQNIVYKHKYLSSRRLDIRKEREWGENRGDLSDQSPIAIV